jgi:glucose/arabinose dehydrogenase
MTVKGRFAPGLPTSGKAARDVATLPVELRDFETGSLESDQAMCGQPVGEAATADGTLLVSEDGNGTIWRIADKGEHP